MINYSPQRGSASSRLPKTQNSPMPLQPTQPSTQPSGEQLVPPGAARMSERTMRASSAAAREVLTARNIVLVSSGWQFCSTFAAKSGREEHKVFLSSLLTAKAKQNCRLGSKSTMVTKLPTPQEPAELASVSLSLRHPQLAGELGAWLSRFLSRREEVVLLRKYSILGAAT